MTSTTIYDAFEVSTSTGDAGLAEGERRQNAVRVLRLARRAALVRQAERAMLLVALEYGHATSDDVLAAVGMPPGLDDCLLRDASGAMVRAGLLEPGDIGCWHLRDAAAALAWLDTHPPLPELTTGRQILLDLENDEPATVAAAAGSF